MDLRLIRVLYVSARLYHNVGSNECTMHSFCRVKTNSETNQKPEFEFVIISLSAAFDSFHIALRRFKLACVGCVLLLYFQYFYYNCYLWIQHSYETVFNLIKKFLKKSSKIGEQCAFTEVIKIFHLNGNQCLKYWVNCIIYKFMCTDLVACQTVDTQRQRD